MRWYASAPSNIALIKYMGKTDYNGNKPTNSSLSYTLTHLNTHVEIEPKTASKRYGRALRRLSTLLADKGIAL